MILHWATDFLAAICLSAWRSDYIASETLV